MILMEQRLCKLLNSVIQWGIYLNTVFFEKQLCPTKVQCWRAQLASCRMDQRLLNPSHCSPRMSRQSRKWDSGTSKCRAYFISTTNIGKSHKRKQGLNLWPMRSSKLLAPHSRQCGAEPWWILALNHQVPENKTSFIFGNLLHWTVETSPTTLES